MTTMTATATRPRAWVGCLGCYNEGNLVGRWLDDPDEIREYRCPAPVTIYNFHEELWVFDHEGAPWLSGECSPDAFADRAEAWNAATDEHDPAVVAAYVANTGADYVDWDTLAEDVGDAYAGAFDSLADWAYELARETEGLPTGPYADYIDWAAVGRDARLGGDIWTAEADGTIHVFWSNR
jgi:hypothetical protein